MQITKRWLKRKGACRAGITWFSVQEETDGVKVAKKLISEKHLDWADWLITRLMDYHQAVRYAVFSAEQVLDIFEKKYPNDNRARQAIEAARMCIDNPSEENKKRAREAADAILDVPGYAADAAYYAACAAYYAACYAARAAYYAAGEETQLKILNYGIQLLERKEAE